MALVTAALLAGTVLFWATRPGPGQGERVNTRWTGRESPHEAAARLVELGLIDRPRLFAWYLGFLAPGVRIAPGPHLLERGLSPRRLVQRLGRLASRPVVRVTIPEGYTHLQIAERLEQNGICASAEFRASARDRKLLDELAITGDSAEGYLFPARYEFFVDADPAELVRQMVKEARKRLARLDAKAGGAATRLRETRGFSERDILILASIVEREAALAEERPIIASVFFNRLDDASFRPARRLQSDPTAAYGCLVAPERAPSCAAYRGRVTPEMVRDSQNPYNTYRHAGLPPGPISNPGEGAIAAVLQPARTDYLYFVKSAAGRHHFGRSFAEHRRAIEAGRAPSLPLEAENAPTEPPSLSPAEIRR
ncbi:MAG TPA: endolytic transglycosylase MltG [Polyangiaceae bacterium]|nr:endolytic transglycosylase MltG [Polyangiaceae bacterium]